MRTVILALMALLLGALALRTGVQILQAAGSQPAALHGLTSTLNDAGPIRVLPVRVTGLVQKVIGRPLGPAETAAILAFILFEAIAVGVIFQLVLGERSHGLIVNGLIALAGAWCVMLLYNSRPGAEAVAELDALVARGLVASVAAPAALILVRAFAASDASMFLAGGETRTGDAMRGLLARFESVANAVARRRPRGPSPERIRGALDRRRS